MINNSWFDFKKRKWMKVTIETYQHHHIRQEQKHWVKSPTRKPCKFEDKTQSLLSGVFITAHQPLNYLWLLLYADFRVNRAFHVFHRHRYISIADERQQQDLSL